MNKKFTDFQSKTFHIIFGPPLFSDIAKIWFTVKSTVNYFDFLQMSVIGLSPNFHRFLLKIHCKVNF